MNAWELIVQQPVVNILIVISSYMGGSFGMAVIALTIIVNIVMFPLTMKQIRASKAMQDLQPQLAEIQKKYAKDRQKLAQEQMLLYKTSGMSPAGCLVPMIIQMPIWIALYQSIMLSLAAAPEGLLNLSKYLYPWPVVFAALPMGRTFLGMNIAEPNMILAVLVGGTMWLQQKMATPVGGVDSRQQAQSRMMLWMMPLMFAFLALSFPSGLALFWVASSVARIAIQYKVTGWGGLLSVGARRPVGRDKGYMKLITQAEEQKSTEAIGADIVETSEERETRDRGLGYLPAPGKTRYQPGKDRSHRHKKG